MASGKGKTFAALPGENIWFSEYHAASVKMSWRVEALAVEQSPYQRMVVMHNPDFGVFFTLDGFLQLTSRDEFIYHDMIVHPALAVNPDIRRVLIVGGGDGGTARETLRYPQLETVDMVEIDEMVPRLCRTYLPQTAAALDDPRLRLTIGDGLAFVRAAADASYDLILVDSTDPVGPGEGLFTREFYGECYRALTEKGILVNQHESAFYAGDLREMRRAHEKIAAVFPIAEVYGFNLPCYSSGYWYFGFASKQLHPLRDQQAARWEAFGLATRYYNSRLHAAAFALPSYVRARLDGSAEAECGAAEE